MIDLERVRADTVGVDDIVHLDNCGSAFVTFTVDGITAHGVEEAVRAAGAVADLTR